MKERHTYTDARNTQNTINGTRNSPRHIIVKRPNILNKVRVLRDLREKVEVAYKGKPIRITDDFLIETLKPRSS